VETEIEEDGPERITYEEWEKRHQETKNSQLTLGSQYDAFLHAKEISDKQKPPCFSERDITDFAGRGFERWIYQCNLNPNPEFLKITHRDGYRKNEVDMPVVTAVRMAKHILKYYGGRSI
jgi:hypothetical protein